MHNYTLASFYSRYAFFLKHNIGFNLAIVISMNSHMLSSMLVKSYNHRKNSNDKIK